VVCALSRPLSITAGATTSENAQNGRRIQFDNRASSAMTSAISARMEPDTSR
jgi:hypothetical protein